MNKSINAIISKCQNKADDYKKASLELGEIIEHLKEIEYYKNGDCMNDCEHYDNCANYIYSKGYNKAINDYKSALIGKYEDRKSFDKRFAYLDLYDIEETANDLKKGSKSDCIAPYASDNNWIPCNIRLPERNEPVLVCDKNGWISISICMQLEGVKNDFENGYYVAWMELPQPYKKGSITE